VLLGLLPFRSRMRVGKKVGSRGLNANAAQVCDGKAQGWTRTAVREAQDLEILDGEAMQILYRPILPEGICMESRVRFHGSRSTGLTGCVNGHSMFVDFRVLQLAHSAANPTEAHRRSRLDQHKEPPPKCVPGLGKALDSKANIKSDGPIVSP